MRIIATVICFFAMSSAALAVGVDEGRLADPAQEARAQGLMKQLRCLVCQNESIVDSNAALAKDLRMIVRERITLGESDEQVLDFMTSRYGDWVLLKPPFEGATIVLWFSPLILLLIGFYVIYHNLKRQKIVATAEPLSADEQTRLKKLLADGDDR
jgi:cytochrome c-type biogenesis protein CcmH